MFKNKVKVVVFLMVFSGCQIFFKVNYCLCVNASLSFAETDMRRLYLLK
jgi:hypothetical protein